MTRAPASGGPGDARGGWKDIIVTRMDQPVVRISRFEPAGASRRLGLLAGRILIAPDFDDWPDDIARALGTTD